MSCNPKKFKPFSHWPSKKIFKLVQPLNFRIFFSGFSLRPMDPTHSPTPPSGHTFATFEAPRKNAGTGSDLFEQRWLVGCRKSNIFFFFLGGGWSLQGKSWVNHGEWVKSW